MEDIDEVTIHLDYPEQNPNRSETEWRALHKAHWVLKENYDGFAWSYEDMTRIDLEVIVHSLQVDPYYPLVKKKNFALKQNNIVNTEIQKLNEMGFVQEMQYPD